MLHARNAKTRQELCNRDAGSAGSCSVFHFADIVWRMHSLDACQPGLCALVSAGVRLCRALGAAHGYAAPIRAKGNGHESLGRSGGWGGLVS